MKKILVFLILLGFYAIASAQVKDIQLWAGPVIKYNFSKKFRLDFEQQLRFNENISNYNFTFSEVALRYKVFKYLDIKALYRYTFIPSDQTGTTVNDYDKSRIAADASTGVELFNSGLEAGLRLRYQDSWENVSLLSSHYIRTRVDLSYNLSKLVDPYADWEGYFRFDGKNKWRQHRYTIGLTWKISDRLDLDSYFRYQNEINVKNPETDYIMGLAVVYTIK